MPKVLVLGGTGYVGRKIPTDFLDFQLEKIPAGRLSRISTLNHEYVINLAASKSNANEQDSLEANYLYPKSIIEKLDQPGVKWIQANTYYELQIESGRNDYYTTHKAQFRDHLAELSKENCGFKFTSLFLPHIFGEDENTNRIIPSIARLYKGERVIFGNRYQEIPLLHVRDAVRAILRLLTLESPKSSYFATPIYIGNLQELLQQLMNPNEYLDNASFEDELDSSVYQIISYPEQLPGFQPKFLFNDLVEYLKKDPE